MNHDEIKLLTEQGYSLAQLATHFEVSNGSIRYWIKKFDLKTNGGKKNSCWDESNIRAAFVDSRSKSDVIRFLGLPINSGNFQTLERHCLKLVIDISVLETPLRYKNGNKYQPRQADSDIFCINSPSANTSNIKRRAIQAGILNEKCYDCNIGPIWNGEGLVLQLDHINGTRSDNREENLRLLCPNCHSQTKTFGGRNKKGAVTQR